MLKFCSQEASEGKCETPNQSAGLKKKSFHTQPEYCIHVTEGQINYIFTAWEIRLFSEDVTSLTNKCHLKCRDFNKIMTKWCL